SDIAEKMGASLSNTTGLLDRLEKSGFVKRSHSEEDRRSVVVQLTENAKKIFRGLYEKGHLKLKRSLELLSPEEKQAVSEGLSILSRALENAKKE
ncbi:MarR family transcriptional regulator, partial [Bacillus velezensis]|uniref:MarR family transcriptional regulator n=2 Tax=Bacillaceae TaxID=186817 RepID=UPI0033932D4B